MAHPKKLKTKVLVDTIFEIRFTPSIDRNAVVGVINNSLKEDFPKLEALPVLQIPETIRSTDPNFKFKPYYKSIKDNAVVQIGPDVLTISSFPHYEGWDIFFSRITNILEILEKLSIINSVERVGLRYINFFEAANIFDDINLKINFADEGITSKNTIFRTEIFKDNFISNLQVSNSAINNGNKGSIIDVDTYNIVEAKQFFSKKEEIVSQSHTILKELFFSILSDELIKKLNPEY